MSDSLVIWKRGWFSQSVLCFVVSCPLIMLETIKSSVDSQALLSLIFVYNFIVFYVLQAAMMHLVIMFARDEPTDIQEAIDVISPKLGSILLSQLRVGLKVFLGCLLLLVPGLIWMYRYLFVSQEVLFGARTTREAMENSARLTDGYKLKIFGVHVLFVIITVVVSILLSLTINSALRLYWAKNGVIVFFTIQYMLTSLVSALSSTFFSLLYLRRREDVYGEPAQRSISVLVQSITSSNPSGVNQLLSKYKGVSQEMSSSSRKSRALVLR